MAVVKGVNMISSRDRETDEVQPTDQYGEGIGRARVALGKRGVEFPRLRSRSPRTLEVAHAFPQAGDLGA
jgi:hypothetical protein